MHALTISSIQLRLWPRREHVWPVLNQTLPGIIFSEVPTAAPAPRCKRVHVSVLSEELAVGLTTILALLVLFLPPPPYAAPVPSGRKRWFICFPWTVTWWPATPSELGAHRPVNSGFHGGTLVTYGYLLRAVTNTNLKIYRYIPT